MRSHKFIRQCAYFNTLQTFQYCYIKIPPLFPQLTTWRSHLQHSFFFYEDSQIRLYLPAELRQRTYISLVFHRPHQQATMTLTVCLTLWHERSGLVFETESFPAFELCVVCSFPLLRCWWPTEQIHTSGQIATKQKHNFSIVRKPCQIDNFNPNT